MTVDCLSSELKVACEIWHHTVVLGRPIWFGKLVESLSWCMSKQRVSESLDTLFDWVIIYGEYGSTGDGRAARLFFVDMNDNIPEKHKLHEIYNKYWKDVRRDT